ncbi:MAG: Flp pilus assembly complex ATPase component TadA [Gemmatimonadetes bacterium]|nr:Flp pilus assembly complex ATPase component TadA [Gemmatimonadota bacterium]
MITAAPSRKTTGPLGQMLIASGAITADDLEAALVEQARTGERLGVVLIRRGADGEHVARVLARQLRLPHATAPLQSDPAALELLDRELATRLRVVPLSMTERGLRVAMADPLDMAAVEDLRFRTGRRVEPCVATPSAVDAALVAAYSAHAVSDVLTKMPGAREDDAGRDVSPEMVDSLRRASEAPPVIALVDLMLAQAIQQRASDVHIEPAGATMRVRARVDGVLREIMALPPHSRGAVVSRIKVMAGLDISVKRRPQDGRCAAHIQGRELVLRVSTLPTHAGEKVVLRLLDSSDAGQRLDQLGMSADLQAALARLLCRSHGVLLVTGPTGSGKTTTLYGALSALDRDRRNLITLEDPVEYRLPGLTQVQMHPKAGLGFAAALRAVLRQDPDVIMVGELRDRETVEIALAAALTGHLVLSTLHTNDAASAPARLHEMGAPAYLVAGGLIGVLAQRLARRLCVHCRAQRMAHADDLAPYGLPARDAQVFVPVGCRRCDGTGYRGRVGIYELLVVTPRMRERIVRRAPADALLELARAEGFTTMGQDAWLKVQAGFTSIAEVAPLLMQAELKGAICRSCGAPVRARFDACTTCGVLLRRRCACGARLDDGWRHCAACGLSTSPASD